MIKPLLLIISIFLFIFAGILIGSIPQLSIKINKLFHNKHTTQVFFTNATYHPYIDLPEELPAKGDRLIVLDIIYENSANIDDITYYDIDTIKLGY